MCVVGDINCTLPILVWPGACCSVAASSFSLKLYYCDGIRLVSWRVGLPSRPVVAPAHEEQHHVSFPHTFGAGSRLSAAVPEPHFASPPPPKLQLPCGSRNPSRTNVPTTQNTADQLSAVCKIRALQAFPKSHQESRCPPDLGRTRAPGTWRQRRPRSAPSSCAS